MQKLLEMLRKLEVILRKKEKRRTRKDFSPNFLTSKEWAIEHMRNGKLTMPDRRKFVHSVRMRSNC